MKITRVGVDLAKSVFQVHGVDRAGRCVWKRQLKRLSWLKVMSETLEPGCEIGMEACGGAHHWARELRARGFTVKLISPQFVKPYLKSLKNDVNDAEAICEAMSRHHMRFVAIKTVEQQDIQALHRPSVSFLESVSVWPEAVLRLRNPNVRFPSMEWSITLRDCLTIPRGRSVDRKEVR